MLTRAHLSNRLSDADVEADNPVFNFENDTYAPSRPELARCISEESWRPTANKSMILAEERRKERKRLLSLATSPSSRSLQDVEASRYVPCCYVHGVTKGRNKTSEGNVRSKRQDVKEEKREEKIKEHSEKERSSDAANVEEGGGGEE